MDLLACGGQFPFSFLSLSSVAPFVLSSASPLDSSSYFPFSISPKPSLSLGLSLLSNFFDSFFFLPFFSHFPLLHSFISQFIFFWLAFWYSYLLLFSSYKDASSHRLLLGECEILHVSFMLSALLYSLAKVKKSTVSKRR